MKIGPCKVYGDSSGDDRPQHIDDLGGRTRAAKADPQEVPWMYAFPAAFSVGVYALGDEVPIVVVPW